MLKRRIKLRSEKSLVPNNKANQRKACGKDGGGGPLCKLFGKSRQAYYDHIWHLHDYTDQENLAVEMVRLIRRKLPGLGGHKLYKCLYTPFRSNGITIGRDKLYKVLKKHSLLIDRKKKRGPGTTNSNHSYLKYPNLIKELAPIRNNELWVSDITYISVGYDFIDTSYVDTYKLSIIVGRNVRAAGIRTEYLVNETLVKKLGYNRYDDILDKKISFFDRNKGTIVGVIKDFHTGSFKSAIAPIFLCNTGAYGVASIKLAGDNPQRTISNIAEIWKNVYPDSPFEYKFMDEKINELYKQEQLLSTLYQIFSGIANCAHQ